MRRSKKDEVEAEVKVKAKINKGGAEAKKGFIEP